MACATLGVSALLLASCAATPSASDTGDGSLLTDLQSAGSVKVSISQTMPYTSLGADGKPTGYVVDLATEVMQALGVPALDATVSTFDAMIPGLQANQVDMAIGGLSITNERCKTIDFSAPFVVVNDALFVSPGNPRDLTSFASVAADSTSHLAVITGSSQEAFALKQNIQDGQLVRVPDVQSGVAAVAGGRADAAAFGQFSVPEAIRQGLEMHVDKSTPLQGGAIAFRKSDVVLRDAFNEQLAKLREDGTLKDLYEEWGFPNWDVLQDVTSAAQIASDCS